MANFLCLSLLISPSFSQEETRKTNWRDTVGLLTIGYLIEGDEKHQRRKLEPFRLALQRATRLKVAYKPVKTLSELIGLQTDRRIQYALHSASSYVTTDILCKCVEPLVVARDGAGASGIHAIIIAPFGGKVRSLSDLKGNRLAVPKPPATITRLLPFHAIKKAGYEKAGELGTIIDIAHPFEGFQKLQKGEVDAFIGWSNLQGNLAEGFSRGTLQQLIKQRGLAKSTDLRIAWRSQLVPNPPHVIRSDMPSQFKELLRNFLLNLHVKNRFAYDSISPELSGGFMQIKRGDFAPFKELAHYLEE